MPRSKRNKVVSLTKTKSKGKDNKSKLINELHDFIDEYKHIFVFSYTNLKGTLFRDIRFAWRESKIFLGKNSITQIAFGRTPEDEFKDNLRHVSELIEGDVGVLFTSRTPQEVKKYFKSYSVAEFAKAGEVSSESVVYPPGPLPFPPSMMDQLRKLGMIVEIEDSQLLLRESFTGAKEGVALTPEQARVLTHFGKKLASFEIELMCHWTDGKFKSLR